jgi:hypothetical protein
MKWTALLLVPAVVCGGLAGCRGHVGGQRRTQVLSCDSNPYKLTSSAAKLTAVHPVVLEAILLRPEFPFAFLGHRDAPEGAGGMTWTAISLALSEKLAVDGCAAVVEADSSTKFPLNWLFLRVSKRVQGVFIQWDYRQYFVDLANIPNAFDPEQPLQRALVRRQLVFVQE